MEKNEKELISLIVIAVIALSIISPRNFLVWTIAGAIYVAFKIFRKEKKEEEDVNQPNTEPVMAPLYEPPKPVPKEIAYIPSQYVFDTKNRIERELRKVYGTEKANLILTRANEMSIDRRQRTSSNVVIGENTRNIVIEFNPKSRDILRAIVGGNQTIRFHGKKRTVVTEDSVPAEKKNTPVPKEPSTPNTFINDDGKEEVKPNFPMIAKDWVNDNLAYLNQVCNNALDPDTQTVKALLEASHLPSDRESWVAIGKSLVEQEEIDAFEVKNDGILIIIE